jgi:hypothetical protein
MTEILRCRQHEAQGTSLVAVVFKALAASGIYYMHGSMNIPFAILLAGLVLFTAHLGAKY